MVNFESVKDYIQGLNQKEMLRLVIVYIVAFICLIGFLLYHHFNALSAAQQKMKTLNKARKDIQIILTEYDRIKNKKSEVDELLAKDTNFYIQKYCQDILNTTKLTTQSPLSLESETWSNGYIEESVKINISQITMKQMCEFLQALQANQLVFVKNLDIVKGSVAKKINVNMVVATLKPIVEKTSSTK